MTLRCRLSMAVVLAVGLAVSSDASADPPPASGTARSPVKLFAMWVDRADRYRGEWEASAARLPPEQASAAVELANHLFGGLWGGYWSSHDGFRKVQGEHFDSRSRVRQAPPEIVEPARSYLLWRMSAVRSNELRRRLQYHAAGEPEFWAAYDRNVDHGVHFGLLKQRAARIIPRLVAERALGFDLHREGVFNTAGSHGMLSSARWQLVRAIDLFEQGDADTGIFHVTDAMNSLRRARSFGIQPGRVRAMLVDHFAERLQSSEAITVYRNEPFTFRETLRDGIAYWKDRADREPGLDLRPLADLYLGVLADADVEGRGELEERVVVTAEGVNSNIEGYLLRELEVVVDDAAGRPVLRRYADLDVLGKLLLFAVLSETGKEALYLQVRGTCEDWLATEQGQAVSGDDLTRTMIGMGSRILTVPGVADALVRTPRGGRLLGRMAVLDSAGFHAHVGNLWVGRALRLEHQPDPASELARLVERIDAFREAESRYGEARLRFRPGTAPPILQTLADAAAAEARTAAELAQAIVAERGLDESAAERDAR